MYINKVTLYGNITKDPELKSLPSGMHVNSFGIATNRVIKDQSGAKKEMTEFHNIVAFGKQAEVIHQYMKKGSAILVEGRIQTRSWDGQDGKKQYRTEIVLENFQFGPKPAGVASSGGYNTASGSTSNAGAVAPAGDDTDAPFNNSASDEGVKYPDEEINPADIPF